MKLYDSELQILSVLWDNGPMSASNIAKILKDSIGWSRNTTYTVIGKCVDKGAVRRDEPKFMCTPLVTREQVQSYETENLIQRMFQGSKKDFFAAFLRDEHLSRDELQELRDLINEGE